MELFVLYVNYVKVIEAITGDQSKVDEMVSEYEKYRNTGVHRYFKQDEEY
jgi:hypothetical protein